MLLKPEETSPSLGMGGAGSLFPASASAPAAGGRRRRARAARGQLALLRPLLGGGRGRRGVGLRLVAGHLQGAGRGTAFFLRGELGVRCVGASSGFGLLSTSPAGIKHSNCQHSNIQTSNIQNCLPFRPLSVRSAIGIRKVDAWPRGAVPSLFCVFRGEDFITALFTRGSLVYCTWICVMQRKILLLLFFFKSSPA